MKLNRTPLTDEYEKSLSGIASAEPKDFFYERLITRLANHQIEKEWAFPLKPVWMICTLGIFLAANMMMLTQLNKSTKPSEKASIQSFAEAYDQHISSY